MVMVHFFHMFMHHVAIPECAVQPSLTLGPEKGLLWAGLRIQRIKEIQWQILSQTNTSKLHNSQQQHCVCSTSWNVSPLLLTITETREVNPATEKASATTKATSRGSMGSKMRRVCSWELMGYSTEIIKKKYIIQCIELHLVRAILLSFMFEDLK